MIPSKRTVGRLKEEIYTNAVGLFCDACTLYQKRSYATTFALAILSLEELGKLAMVDHICDDICINSHVKPQDFLKHLFSRSMFLSHNNKQAWAAIHFGSDDLNSKRHNDISEGDLDRAKQDALYVGYFKGKIRSPKEITRRKAYLELSYVVDLFREVRDMGFNGFDGDSNSSSRAKANRRLKKVEAALRSLRVPSK